MCVCVCVCVFVCVCFVFGCCCFFVRFGINKCNSSKKSCPGQYTDQSQWTNTTVFVAVKSVQSEPPSSCHTHSSSSTDLSKHYLAQDENLPLNRLCIWHQPVWTTAAIHHLGRRRWRCGCCYLYSAGLPCMCHASMTPAINQDWIKNQKTINSVQRMSYKQQRTQHGDLNHPRWTITWHASCPPTVHPQSGLVEFTSLYTYSADLIIFSRKKMSLYRSQHRGILAGQRYRHEHLEPWQCRTDMNTCKHDNAEQTRTPSTMTTQNRCEHLWPW